MLAHAPGSPERARLGRALELVASERIEIPLVVGGERIRSDRQRERLPVPGEPVDSCPA